MYLDVSQSLRAPGEAIAFTHRDEIAPQVIFGETLTFDPVLITGSFTMLDNTLRLQGRLRTAVHASCAWCLAPVIYTVDVPVDELFTRVERGKGVPTEENTDGAEDDERLAFEGSKVELHQLALTLTLLDLPLRFVCEPECEAAKKGRQEDKTSHACQKELPDQHPFSALQQLLTKDQEV